MIHLNLIQKIIIWFLPVLFAITVHEAAHAFMAAKLGDKTAQMLGRLTLNPLKHIDLVGTVLIPLLLLSTGGFIFGWAKPVPITPRNLRRPRRDLALVSLAGPLSNLLMAVFWAGIMKVGVVLLTAGVSKALPIVLMGEAGILINLVLATLNLLPLPPLDGGHFVSVVLPPRIAYYYDKLERYGFLIVLLLISTGGLNYLLNPIVLTLRQILMLVFQI